MTRKTEPKKRRFLPVALDLFDKRCLIVGGGDVGTRKVLTLDRAGARVTVVAPMVSDVLEAHIEVGRIDWIEDSFREEHLADAFLVIAATDDVAENARIVELAISAGLLSCDASSSERSELIFGALLDTDDATIAVFTDGREPAHARRTRDRIARFLAEDGHVG